jgi:hypothetical protein
MIKMELYMSKRSRYLQDLTLGLLKVVLLRVLLNLTSSMENSKLKSNLILQSMLPRSCMLTARVKVNLGIQMDIW